MENAKALGLLLDGLGWDFFAAECGSDPCSLADPSIEDDTADCPHKFLCRNDIKQQKIAKQIRAMLAKVD